MNKKCIGTNYALVLDGSFAIDDPNVQEIAFKSCRERFASHFKESTNGVFLKHPVGKSESVIEFLKKTEEILKLPEKSAFAITDKGYLVWMNPSSFWKSCRMKRSLFTMLARAGMDFEGDYEKALLNERSVARVPDSVMKFLFGFTRYVGQFITPDPTIDVYGWVYTFEGVTEKKLRTLLVRP